MSCVNWGVFDVNRKATVSISKEVNDILVNFSKSEGVTKSKAVTLLINSDSIKTYYKNQYNARRHKLRRASRQKTHISLVGNSGQKK